MVRRSRYAGSIVLLVVAAFAGCSAFAPASQELDRGDGMCPAGEPGSGCAAEIRAGGVPRTCHDGRQDGNETDVDCGGPDCKPCSSGRACLDASDCQSAVCSGAESQHGTCCDIECSGPCMSCTNDLSRGRCLMLPAGSGGHCGNGKACTATGACVAGKTNGSQCSTHDECVSKVCALGTCRQAPSTLCDHDSDCGANLCLSVNNTCLRCTAIRGYTCPADKPCNETTGNCGL